MTNSEAIEYGKEQLEIFGGQHAEFIRMAIEALSCSEKPNESNLVSRQDVINEIARWEGYLDEDMIYRIQLGLKRLPSAQSEYPLLKIIQDFKEATGCNDILVVQKDAMKAWDENGVAYTMQPERTGEIVIDFDLKDDDGKRCNGLHLHYIYEGDPRKLSWEEIEDKEEK